MITAIIESVIRFRWVAWSLVAALTALSLYALGTTALDAIPDISDPQVIVYVKWPRSPQLIETEITEPVIRSLAGSPDIRAIRGTSHMGYSFIYVILNNADRRTAVRQLVTDRLAAIRGQLPPDATVTLGPNASSMGWIYQYALVDRESAHDLRDLRLLHENRIKPALQAVPGIAEVGSLGGLEKQYQVKLFPPLLAERGISLSQVVTATRAAFQESGGRTIEVTNREYQLRGAVNTASLDDLEFLVLGRGRDGQPVRLKDVGYFQVGYDLRRGIADLDGSGEVVGGIAIMEQGRNVLAVTHALQGRIDQVKTTLPPGVEIVPTYDRSSLIWATLTDFFQAIVYQLIVVILVITVALRNVRAAVAPVCILLFGTLFTALPLAAFGQTINLFSLAGLSIAIGEMADATIVIVENCTADLARRGALAPAERMRAIIRATATMTRPLLFSMLIIVTSFLPVFFLGERETRLFNPLAYSKTFAMAFSTLLTLFLLPIVIVWVFRHGVSAPPVNRESVFVRTYRATLTSVIRYRYGFVGISAALFVVAGVLMLGFQKDYMPEMEEGSILYMPTTLPGLPSREAGWILQQMDRKLKTFPEVERVFGKLGRADTATDPAPVEMVETTVMLKPKSQWRPGMTKEKLIAEMNQAMEIVGYVNGWTQPISTRVVMQDTGIQTPVGIKVKGEDLAVVEDIAHRIEALLKDFPGTQAVIAERISRGSFVDARLDLQRMAAHGVTVDEAMSTVRFGIGGDNIVSVRQADKALVPLAVQYSGEYIDTLDKVRKTSVVTQGGDTVPLGEIADVSVRESPEMIRNDNGELAGYIYVYLRGVTGPEYVDRARAFLAEKLTVPTGYTVEWTGVFTYAEDARAKLQIVVPITLIIMFGLLLMAFRSVADSTMIMLSAPFALVGGVFLQRALGYPMTTAVIIGYVSLFAVAIQTGIIMIEFIREALAGRPENQSYMDAVVAGSVTRLRPKLMTVATTVLGLLPIMIWSTSGLDIAKPIATPVFGGMISSTVYVLFLIPCLFAIGEDSHRRWPGPFPGRPLSVLAMCLMLASCGRQGDTPAATLGRAFVTAGKVSVAFSSDPDPLRPGTNSLIVTVADADGKPVDDATVKVTLSMPAMPSMNMPAMRTESVLPGEGAGRYRGTGQLSMGGTWNVIVSVSRGTEELGSNKFSVVAAER